MKSSVCGWFIILFLACAHADESYIASDKYLLFDETNNEFSTLPYDEKSYELAYQSFVYSGRVQEAFALASQAVRKNLASQLWRERLIKSALWSNHPYDALQHMQSLIVNEHKAQYLKQAVQLATQLKSFNILEKLLEYKYQFLEKTPEVMLNLAYAYYQQGKTAQGLELLDKGNYQFSNKAFLKMKSQFLQDQYKYSEEKKILRAIVKLYGWDVETSLRLAEIEYNAGHIQKALNLLNQVPARLTHHHVDFWRLKGGLEWGVGNIDAALNSYRKLFSLGKMDSEESRRLFSLLQDLPSKELLNVARYRLKYFPSTEVFFNALNVAEDLNDQNTMLEIYHQHFNSDLKKALLEDPAYYQGAANLWLKLNNGYQAQQVMLLFFNFMPHLDLAVVNYLSWIAEQSSRVNAPPYPKSLENALLRLDWQLLAASDIDILYPYAYGLLLTDRNFYAATIYSHYLNFVLPVSSEKIKMAKIKEIRNFKNITWNARYADVLERSGFYKSARRIRWYTWLLMQHQMTAHVNDPEWQDIYRELSLEFVPITNGYPSILYSMSHGGDGAAQDALMSWAINREQVILADQMAHRLYQIPVPLWAAARLSMWHNDLPMMRKLLDHYSSALPRKEAVNMALQLGARPEAQQHSFRALQQDVRDAERYEFFKEAFLPVTNEAGWRQEYLQNGVLQGFHEKIHAKWFLKNRYFILPYATLWQIKSRASDQLAALNYNQQQMGLKIGELTHRYNWNIDAGKNDALYSSNYLTSEMNYQLYGQWFVGGRIAYNEMSQLNNDMQIAGSQDQIQGRLQYQMTQRDMIMSELSFNHYRLQDRTSIGKGIHLENNIEHKFWFSYPDYKIIVNAGIHKFMQENKILTGKVIDIFPQNVEPNANVFLPSTYWDTGVSLGFGENLLEDYTQAWRPFASVGTNYQSTIGLGYDVLAGISGSVLGRDKLIFYYMQSQNSHGAVQKNYVYGIGYKIFF